MAAGAHDDPLLDALAQHFGHGSFREGQREVVEAILAGDDVVLVMPTGGGKSLCYQLPALLETAPTVVISPLIALMKDQIDQLSACGIAAGALHSNMPASAQRTVESAYRSGALRLLYVAPERLVRPDLRAMLEASPPRRLVVDEAHCISEWGHDFRRDYLRIGDVAAALAPVQLVACTATATPEVRADIAERLGQRAPRSFVHGFARPNLVLSVERVRDEGSRLARLDQLIDPGEGHAIVYAGTRARAATVAARLSARHPTMLYHAELSAEERVDAQERFRSGRVRIAVTTSAFGMGVDIPTVRQVVHIALPSSLEEYYQQAGRAGRDGLAATCTVLFTAADRRLPQFFIEAAHPEPEVIAGVYRTLLDAGGDPGAWRLVEHRDPAVQSLSDAAGDRVRDLLREEGLIDARGAVVEHDPRRLPIDHRRIAAHRRLAFRRLDTLFTYLSSRGCRHAFITEHFGEGGHDSGCGDRCDVCAAASTPGAGRGAPLDSLTVRRALSAVARLNGRVGVAKLAGVLAGSRSQAVSAIPGATLIPTYGALAGWREADLVELLRRIQERGLVTQGPPPYPTVSITAAGVEVMRGDREAEIDDPRGARPPTAPGGEAPVLDGDAAERFSRLRAWRSQTARSRDVPAYIVFPDRTLTELAMRAPRTTAELAAVPGVGPNKLALYGADVLAQLGGVPEEEAV